MFPTVRNNLAKYLDPNQIWFQNTLLIIVQKTITIYLKNSSENMHTDEKSTFYFTYAKNIMYSVILKISQGKRLIEY